MIEVFLEEADCIIPDFNVKEMIAWISGFSKAYPRPVEAINFILLSDDQLLEINKEYLQHDYYTDVITFDYNEGVESIVSDVFVSVERVAENASQLNLEFHKELARVFIHAFLHLQGFSDSSEMEKHRMREEEDMCLERYRL